MEDIFSDPQFQDRDMLVNITDPYLGEVTLPGLVPKLSENPGHIWRAGGELGEDTEAVLKDELRLSADDIEKLFRNRTVRGSGPVVGEMEKNDKTRQNGLTK
jgi:formyl-CoA transferase